MAARKKTKVKTKRRKVTARRPAVRRKAAKPVSRPARKAPAKGAARKAAKPKAAKPKAVKRTAVKTKAIKPKSAKPAAPLPAERPAPGERVGFVTHFYGEPSVAIVKLESGTLRVGDTIHFRGHTSDFSQRVESLQIEHAAVNEVGPNDDFGVKVVQHVREHDVVYKVTS